MSITTFTQLMAAPISEKVKLVEISPSENLGTNVNWSVYAGTVYQLSYLYESVTLTNDSVSKILKEVTAMRTIDSNDDIVDLTQVDNISECTADTTSFYHDTTNGILYVNMDGVTGTGTPLTTLVLMATFTMRFASKGIVLNGYYYEPYVESTPTINQSAGDLLSGRSEVSTANMSFYNDGFWDIPFYKFVWNNRAIAVKFGGEDLPYSEYRTVFTGIITEKNWGLTKVEFQATSIQSKLDILIPSDTYTLTDYPNIYASAIGEVIPIAYGSFDSRTAPIVTAIDESYAANQVKYKLAGHAINSVTSVYILYGNGADWVTLTLDNALSSDNTYKVDSLTTATIIVRFTAGGYAGDTVKVKVAFEGKELSAGVLMDNPSDIVKDLITTYSGFTIDDIDTTVFATSKTVSDANVSIYLNSSQSMQDVIRKICLSDMAYFFVNDMGQFSYKTFSPTIAVGSTTIYTDSDFLNYSAKFPSEYEFKAIRVQYSQAYNTNQTYQSTTAHGTNVASIYDVTRSKLVNTYLNSSSDADVLAQRMALLHTPPFEIIEGITKWQFGDVELGDRVTVSLTRLPGEEFPANEILEIVSLSKNFSNHTIFFRGIDIRVFGLHVGFWMGASAPNWDTATATERTLSGFWCDADGYADAPNANSLNQSLWW